MDMLTVDVTDLDERRVRATKSCSSARRATSRQQTIDAREMAASIGTIPYEILCRLGTVVSNGT